MSIANRELNARLGALETCAEEAPEGTFADVKPVVEAVHDISNYALTRLREAGLEVGNDDRLRNLEVAIYAFILESNREAYGLMAGEGFGRAMSDYGPEVAKRVMAQTVANRDFLRNLGVTPVGHA